MSENQSIVSSQAVSEPKPPPKPKKESRQSNVDRFWTKFSTKYPGTVRAVLPSDGFAKKKALQTKRGAVGGKSAVKSYEQAASECKRAVEKISKECRRVNHKYRDQHFDIEFDLKTWTRDCLDSLDVKLEEREYPKSVKRVSVSILLLLCYSGVRAHSHAGHFHQASILSRGCFR